jgi:hypothetical protein
MRYWQCYEIEDAAELVWLIRGLAALVAGIEG